MFKHILYTVVLSILLISFVLLTIFGICYIFWANICPHQIDDAALGLITDVCNTKEGREKVSKYYYKNKKLRAEWNDRIQKKELKADLKRLDTYLKDQDERMVEGEESW